MDEENELIALRRKKARRASREGYRAVGSRF